MSYRVEHVFETEEEAKSFEENAMTAFHFWRFQTGKLKQPHCDRQDTVDGEECASNRLTGHSLFRK